MARDDDEDLYDEEFDFVDDDDTGFDDDGEVDGEPAAEERMKDDRDRDDRYDLGEQDGDAGEVADEEPVDEYGRTAPKADYLVHIYEHSRFTRTIDRPFTPEEAEAFASEYNRTGKSYGRLAVAGKNDSKPKKALD